MQLLMPLNNFGEFMNFKYRLSFFRLIGKKFFIFIIIVTPILFCFSYLFFFGFRLRDVVPLVILCYGVFGRNVIAFFLGSPMYLGAATRLESDESNSTEKILYLIFYIFLYVVSLFSPVAFRYFVIS